MVVKKLVQVNVDEQKCTACGTCVEACPVSNFELRDKGAGKVSTVISNDACIACKACETECPEQAITVIE